MNQAEQELAPEILRMRADAVIRGFERMIGSGLPFREVQLAEQENAWCHRDLFLVHLGLKPAAALYDPIPVTYGRHGFNYLSMLPKSKDTGISTVHSLAGFVGFIWNPDMVQKIMQDGKNQDLVSRALEDSELADLYRVTPYNPEFDEFLLAMADRGAVPEVTTLEGMFFGYPREDAQPFAEHFPRLSQLITTLPNTARQRGFGGILPDEFTIGQVLQDRELKTNTISLAEQFGFKYKDTLDYLRSLRMSNAPGTPYVTNRVYPTDCEERLQRLYYTSGMEAKFKRFLPERN